MMTPRRWTAAVAALIAILPAASRAQAPATREAIEADFRRDVIRAERTRIERLAALAASQPKAEASKTYAELFRLAIASGLYAEAEPTAERLVRSGGATADMGLLADVVNVLAKAERGAYQESLDSLAEAIKARDDADAAGGRRTLPISARLALANIYVEHLIHAAQYDVARRALTMIRDSAGEPALKSLAERRLAQVDLVGKPAPPIVGTSIDGQPVRLADSKGDVVLVVFWATWCAPNAEEAERLGVLEAANRGKGLRIIGINLDPMQDGGVPAESVMPNVRRFLVDHNVRWPNLLNGPGDRDYARAFGVTEIPANALIGRDGTVLHLDLTAATLEPAVAKALGR
ncbi:MAG TPA: TlpA disulfide reductase family protein [Isosphaeraceae bacterium]|jgi:thiol-disulfide isomerase/thioredoxin